MSSNGLFINLSYVLSATLFIFGLKLLSHPDTARKGNFLSALGMLMAAIVTLLHEDIIGYELLLVAMAAGAMVGVFAAKTVAMTAMPQLVSLFNGVGGLASALVAWATLVSASNLPLFVIFVSAMALTIGGLTFSGSLIAWGKLSERLPGRPLHFRGQKIANLLLAAVLCLCLLALLLQPLSIELQSGLIGLALLFGVLMVLPIGGADMPVVISILNSFSGLAACAAGFAIENNLLIVAGSLVGASGTILTSIMCKAMNRSLVNVLTSGFQAITQQDVTIEGEAKAISADDAYYVLEAAESVVVIPGYGMAVAQAQHALKELQQKLEQNGAHVAYAIHPVAGRMPGHMNVLLAEADVSYEQLFEMDDINPKMERFDVAIVIGANDVVNPAAREMKGSPIYGMPVINADLARNVFILKRSMASGFAGVANPLFYKPNCRMIFGDAKETLAAIIHQFSE